MKRHDAITVAIIAILIAGFLYKYQEKNNKQKEFEMKSKCANYETSIKKKLEETKWSSSFIDEIFYSPKMNSCLYSVIAYQGNRSDPYSAYIIWDQLTNNMIFYRDTSLTNNQNLSDIFQNAKKYLKGEESLRYSEKDWNLN